MNKTIGYAKRNIENGEELEIIFDGSTLFSPDIEFTEKGEAMYKRLLGVPDNTGMCFRCFRIVPIDGVAHLCREAPFDPENLKMPIVNKKIYPYQKGDKVLVQRLQKDPVKGIVEDKVSENSEMRTWNVFIPEIEKSIKVTDEEMTREDWT